MVAGEFTDEELIEKVKEIMEGSDIIENGRLLTVQLTRSIGASPRLCR
jgi:hypothetical protein